jgi:hypothetical protein
MRFRGVRAQSNRDVANNRGECDGICEEERKLEACLVEREKEEEEENRTMRRENQEQLRGTMDDPANHGAAAAEAAEAAMHTQREPLQAIKHQSKSLPEWETNG